jgi:hypothetical protein
MLFTWFLVGTLFLTHLDDIYLVPILKSLPSNKSVKVLQFRLCHETPSLESSVAIQRLLESTSSIEGFQLTLRPMKGEETFRLIAEGLTNSEESAATNTLRPIAQGLINSESVTDIQFEYCDFAKDQGSTVLFKSILESKSNIHTRCRCRYM